MDTFEKERHLVMHLLNKIEFVGDGKYRHHIHMSTLDRGQMEVWIQVYDFPCTQCEIALHECASIIGLVNLGNLPFVRQEYFDGGNPSTFVIELSKGMRLLGISDRKVFFEKRKLGGWTKLCV